MKESTKEALALTKLFIGGIERSGTTVLASALARYLNGVAIPEAQFKKFLLASEAGPEVMRDVRQSMRFRLWDLPHQEYQAASGAETFDCIVNHMLAKHGIATPALTIDHTPENCGCGAELLAAFPAACLIHITRDPRAVISSLMRTDWGVPTLGDALSYWRKRNALAERAFALAEGSFGARVATLSYEELCDAPDETLARLCGALGVTPSASQSVGATLVPRYTQTQHQRVADLPRNDFQWRTLLSASDIERIEAELAETQIGRLYGFQSGPIEGSLPRASAPKRAKQWIRARLRRRRKGVDRIDLPPWSSTAT